MNEREKELARRFYISFLSYNLGIGMQYAYKTYLEKDQDVGAMWHYLAKAADEIHAMNMEEASKRLTEKVIQ
jgi:hypothetical protein